jgi:TonB family protein
MRRWILLALAVLSTAVVVFTHSSSFAQQGEPEAERRVLVKVVPKYPDLARKMNVHGVVKLTAVIEPDGKVKSTEVIGGNPVLVQAALEAVRQWKFETAPQQTRKMIELRFDER